MRMSQWYALMPGTEVALHQTSVCMLLWAKEIRVVCSLSLIQTAMRQLSALAMAVNMLVMKKISLALAKRMVLPPICQLKPATVSRYSAQPSHK